MKVLIKIENFLFSDNPSWNQERDSATMNHVQAVTVLEASNHDTLSFGDKNNVTVKRHVLKDSNNNSLHVTKESLNVKSQPSISEDEPTEYSLFGLVTFKSPIKWLNTISIILIHLIGVYGFIIYPLRAKILTTVWGEYNFPTFHSSSKGNWNSWHEEPFKKKPVFENFCKNDHKRWQKVILQIYTVTNLVDGLRECLRKTLKFLYLKLKTCAFQKLWERVHGRN